MSVRGLPGKHRPGMPDIVRFLSGLCVAALIQDWIDMLVAKIAASLLSTRSAPDVR